MKQQIVVVHGGTTFENYGDFLLHLKSSEVDLNRLRSKIGWKKNLQNGLRENYDVILAEMPNRENAKYLEWAVYFNKLLPLLDEELILVGHSLGGIFLVKFLSENLTKKKVKALILVAAPFDDVDSEESLGDFRLLSDFNKLKNQCEKVFLIQSEDDNVVPYSEAEKYKEILPQAKILSFKDRGHFNQEDFKEMANLIKTV